MLPAGLQADVLQIGAIGDYDVEHVAEHLAVDFAVFGLVGSVRPGGVEHVGDVGEGGELGSDVLRVGDVAPDVGDRVVVVPGGAGAAGDAVDLPGAAGGVREGEDLGQAVADDSGDADDQGHALVLRRRIVVAELLLLRIECA
ncbi:ABC transporter ATP-binding protein [Striga asiatica]|uniref:ABC transporter ATP-binding protein n=1 Tax=Striga asiatica TaxID=4170 RepID=A0A5A7PVM2_STRAF|nr:ABC transporter ATP-binding protein [Striga asiatica]